MYGAKRDGKRFIMVASIVPHFLVMSLPVPVSSKLIENCDFSCRNQYSKRNSFFGKIRLTDHPEIVQDSMEGCTYMYFCQRRIEYPLTP